MYLILFVAQLLISCAYGQLSTTTAGTTLNRFNQFVSTLSTIENGGRVVHSSGGAAGGVVSEGQGYGLFLGGATAAALSPTNSQFNTVVNQAYQLFQGWKKMCMLSTSDGCQSTRYCTSGGSSYPCLPHWKFNDQLTSAQGTGSAPDGDEDAILGMILLLKATASNKPSWWTEVNNWAYQSSKQFYESSTAPSGSWRIVKLGACWGGWDCNNPSYHAPAAYRAMKDFMSGYSDEGKSYASKWDTVISTSYAVLLAGQNPYGLVTNWYVPNSNPTVTGTTGCSGSGTPAAEFGSEASRTVWRVVLDYVWYGDARAKTFLDKLVPSVASKFASNSNLQTGGLVTSIHSGWLNNAFMYGPTLSSLVYPKVSNQQTTLNSAGSKIAGGTISDYYSGSWLALSTFVINGDALKVASLLTGNTPVPVPQAPVPVPQAPVPVPQAPVPVPQAPVPVPRAPVPVPQAPVPVPRAPVPVPRAPAPVPQAPFPVPRAPVLVPQAPVPVPRAPVPAPTSGGACAGVVYGSPSNNDWWLTVSGIPNPSLTDVTIRCASGQQVACTKSGWGDRYACAVSNNPCTSPRSVTFSGQTCALNNDIINNARMDESTDAESSDFPAYSIALLVVGAVGIVLVVGAFALILSKKFARSTESV